MPVFGSSGVVGYHNKALIKGPAIIVGRKGNVGSVFWSNEDFYPIDTTFYVAPEQSDIFVYLLLLNQNFLSGDAAVPGLNRNYAHSIEVLAPEIGLRQKFLEVVRPMFDQIHTLTQQNTKLAEARDLLLPRLMDGRIIP